MRIIAKVFVCFIIIVLIINNIHFVLCDDGDWLEGWNYRKVHNIIGSSNAGENYQIRINVYYDSGSDDNNNVYLDSLCDSDFGDIRFTDNDGITELYYWLEYYIDSDNAVFWINVEDDLSYNQEIYIYYGSEGRATTSDGDNTFLFFDHFDTLDTTNKWFEEFGNWVISDSKLRNTVSDTRGRLRSKTFQIDNGSILCNLTGVVAEIMVEVEFRGTTGMRNTAGTNLYMFAVDVGGNQDCMYREDGTSWTQLNTSSPYSTNWNVWEIQFHGSNLTLLKNDILKFYCSDSTYSDGYIALYTSGNSYKFEWIAVRNFVSPEPLHDIWGEQEIYTSPSYVTESEFESAIIFILVMLLFGVLFLIMVITKKSNKNNGEK